MSGLDWNSARNTGLRDRRRAFVVAMSKSSVFRINQIAPLHQVLLGDSGNAVESNLDHCLGYVLIAMLKRSAESDRFALRNTANLEPHYIGEMGSKSSVGAHSSRCNSLVSVNQLFCSIRIEILVLFIIN